MTNKEIFITEIEKLIETANNKTLSDAAMAYFEALKSEPAREKVELTENGAKILKYMQENWEKYNNVFKSKEIGEGLFISSRSVSGSMKKLVTEGFVNKIGNDPVCYEITEKGKERDLT